MLSQFQMHRGQTCHGRGAQRGVMPYNVGRRVLAAAFMHAIILRCDVFANGDHIGIDEVTATFGCR